MKLRTLLLCATVGLISAAVTAQGQTPGINSTLATVFTLAYDNSTMKQTFSATSFFTPATTPGDVCSLQGSATKVIKVRRVLVGGTAAVAITEYASVLKRSTANTNGNGNTMTKVPYDAQNAASTASLAESWTTANTTMIQGTLVGVLTDRPFLIGSTTTTAPVELVELFGQLGQPIVLRTAAQGVAVNLEGQGGGAGTLTCTFEWTEE